jgi:hypothetical protein
VAKFEDNTLINKKVMIQVQVCGRQRQRRRDHSNTSTFFVVDRILPLMPFYEHSFQAIV